MPFNRRSFIQQSVAAGVGAGFVSFAGNSTLAYPRPEKNAISLALWSLISSFRAGVWKLTDAHRICREDFGIDGIEYVTAFFEVPVESYLRRLNKAADEHGVKNVLIMVDDEGDMVAKDKAVRMQAAVNHRKWIEIAAYLGCHAIRCNARGGAATAEEDPDALNRAAESFSALIEYAKEFKINVVIENHGGLSSDPKWLPQLIKKVGAANFGILPDYGNYLQGTDFAEAVRLAMPYAKGVSVKAGWMSDGTHPQYDLDNLLKISKDAGYTGFWGIESSIRRKREERPETPEDRKKDDWQAVLWTKAAIERVVIS
ncbi:MAG TPA: sugar phosphate isomerase/epimerase family protein [Acidobacteriota bacterium]|nr:sugar phosphate isomerase/epimerase family protein [Acidobacteriota bacterium]